MRPQAKSAAWCGKTGSPFRRGLPSHARGHPSNRSKTLLLFCFSFTSSYTRAFGRVIFKDIPRFTIVFLVVMLSYTLSIIASLRMSQPTMDLGGLLSLRWVSSTNHIHIFFRNPGNILWIDISQGMANSQIDPKTFNLWADLIEHGLLTDGTLKQPLG